MTPVDPSYALEKAFQLSIYVGITLASPIRQNDVSLDPRVTAGGLQNGLWLRPMPLGASITYGLTSNDGNGYREFLRELLVNYGNPVNMVGSRRNGTMEDNDVEGWPGDIIDEVHEKAKTAVPKVKLIYNLSLPLSRSV